MSWIATAGLICSSLTALHTPVGQGLSLRTEPWFDYNRQYVIGFGPASYAPHNEVATIWNAKDGAVVRRITGHKEFIVRMEFAPGGRKVLTSSFLAFGETRIPSKDNSIRIWDIATGKQLLKIPYATHGRFSRDGKRILGFTQRSATNVNFDIAAWDMKTGKKLFTSAIHGYGPRLEDKFTFEENIAGTRLLYVQGSMAVVFDSRSGKRLAGPWARLVGVSGAAFAPDGDEVQLAEIRNVSSFSVETSMELQRVRYPIEHAWRVGFPQDGKGFAGVNAAGMVMSYDRKTGKMISAPGGVEVPHSVLVSPNGSHFVVNWGGTNAIPLQAKGFDAKNCASAWDCRGRVMGLSGRDEAILLDGLQVSVIEVSSGRVVRKFKLRGVEE